MSLLTEQRVLQKKRLAGNLLCVLCLVAAAVFPLAVSSYGLTLLTLGSIYAIACLGLSIAVSWVGLLTLAQAAFFGVGAYSVAILTVHYNLPWIVAVALGIAISGLLGSFLGLSTLKIGGHYLAMVTISFQFIVSLLLNNWKGLSGGPDGITNIPRPSLGPAGFQSDLIFYYFILGVLALCLVAFANLHGARTWRALRAIKENELAAKVMGIDVFRFKVLSFTLSSVYAGLAGGLYASALGYISPSSFSFEQSVVFLTMVLVGGTGVYGPTVGALIITFIPEWLRFLDKYYLAVYGLFIILVILFMPEGLAGTVSRRLGLHNLKKGGQQQSAVKKLSTGASFGGGDLLAVAGASKHFGGLKALDNVSFDLKQGKIAALIGPNGSGKTTMLNVISGIYQSNSGNISFAGRDITREAPHRITGKTLARTFQNIRLFPDLTVLENVLIGYHCRYRSSLVEEFLKVGRYRQEEAGAREYALACLEFVGLTARQNENARNLPYGEQKLVEIARALASQPSLVLLDEPAAGLNSTETMKLARIIKRMKDEGITVLLVEHDMSLVMTVADDIVVLNFGRKISQGVPEQIRSDPEVIEAYLGRSVEDAEAV